MTWTVMMQSANDVHVNRITTKKAILKRRLADLKRFLTNNSIVCSSPVTRPGLNERTFKPPSLLFNNQEVIDINGRCRLFSAK
ncbi:MAG TPA: hypothetical protein VHO84_13710 [Syntrophorhabdaceae bacterium]|nr:hypothetical protein [Syntrophorhabdaceae bacterium]